MKERVYLPISLTKKSKMEANGLTGRRARAGSKGPVNRKVLG